MRIFSTIIAVTIIALGQHGCGDKNKAEAPVAATDDQKLLQEAAIAGYGEAEGKKKMGELLKAAKEDKLTPEQVKEFIKKIMISTKGFQLVFKDEKANLDIEKDEAKMNMAVKKVTSILKQAAPAKDDDKDKKQADEKDDKKDVKEKGA